MLFHDREDAGKKLAQKLLPHKTKNAVVYALPRGGVITGAEIAKTLNVPLDVIIVRKIGNQYDQEYAIGAVAEDGHALWNEVEREHSDPEWLENKIRSERLKAIERRQKYLGARTVIPARGKTAILVDDGIATGLSIMLAISEIEHQKPEKIIVAVPVVPHDVAKKIKKMAVLVALEIPTEYFGAVGSYYENFPQIEDEEVVNILRSAKK